MSLSSFSRTVSPMNKQLAPLNNVYAEVVPVDGGSAVRGHLIAVTCDLDQNPIATLYLFATRGGPPVWVNERQVSSAQVLSNS